MSRDREPGRWLSWLVGVVLFVAVVVGALHVSEAGAFAELLDQARPGWLALAIALQASTYVAQGLIWRGVVRTAGMGLPLGVAFRLSLVKLLVDQALPSSGLSGSIFVAGALQRRGVRDSVTTAAIVVSSAGYLGAYAIAILAGLGLVVRRQTFPIATMVVAASVFVAAALVIVAAIATAWRRAAAGSPPRAVPQWLMRHLVRLRRHAIDPSIARSPRLLLLSTGLQLGIIALDCLTMWALIRSLGSAAPVAAVFGSFMVASLLRTFSIIPGGLGPFEAASVLTLHAWGLPVALSLSATLLFRALSFWLPMLPGAWLARGFLRRSQEGQLTFLNQRGAELP